METVHIVAKADELAEGQMKEIAVGGARILLLRSDGRFRAFASACPHQGAPLAEGLLHAGHIRCPWHMASFDADTGALRDPPALDCLPPLDVRVEGDEVVVKLPQTMPTACEPAMVRPDPAADGRTFVILGAGAAGEAAAEQLRRDGFRGRLLLITREPHRPYDRTELSKTYLKKPSAPRPLLRPDGFYKTHGIEVLTGCEAQEVDVAAKTICLAGGDRLRYDRLLLATGGSPRTLGVAGEELANVYRLRSLDDCERIRAAAAAGPRVVIVGAGFIAMEVSAALAKAASSVTVVAPESVPLGRVFGERIGRMYQQAHQAKGVAFRLGHTVERFVGDRSLEAVVLDSGERLEADLAVVGVGVRPATDYLTGLDVNEDGSISVDRHMQAGEDVWAAGDIARLPDWRTGGPIRIEHWRVAQQQGRMAGRNMAGIETDCRDVPFFWTDQFMLITDYLGHARQWDEVIFDGDPDQRRFVAFYLQAGRVVAAAGCEQSRKMCLLAELLRAEEPEPIERVREQLAEL